MRQRGGGGEARVRADRTAGAHGCACTGPWPCAGPRGQQGEQIGGARGPCTSGALAPGGSCRSPPRGPSHITPLPPIPVGGEPLTWDTRTPTYVRKGSQKGVGGLKHAPEWDRATDACRSLRRRAEGPQPRRDHTNAVSGMWQEGAFERAAADVVQVHKRCEAVVVHGCWGGACVCTRADLLRVMIGYVPLVLPYRSLLATYLHVRALSTGPAFAVGI